MDVDLTIPADATDAEAAAISAAVEAHVRALRAAAAANTTAEESTWQGRRWRVTGRLEGLGRSDVGAAAGRIPADCPVDGWTAAGRADRF